MSRINISKGDSGEAIFGNPKPKCRGIDGAVKRKSFFGQSIKVIGKDEQGTLTTEKLNKGSLIDFLNTQLKDHEKLEKGWFFHASDEKVQDAYAKVFANNPLSNAPISNNQNSGSASIPKPSKPSHSAIPVTSTQAIQTAPSGNQIKISVHLSDDTELSIDIDPNKTVEEFKEEICNKMNNQKYMKKDFLLEGIPLAGDETLKSYDIKNVIYQKYEHKPVINKGAALSFDQVLERAKTEFSNDPQRDVILKKIRERLHSIHYSSSLKDGEAPYLNQGISPRYEIYGYLEFVATDEEKVNHHLKQTINKFLFALPGVDIAGPEEPVEK